MEQNTLLDIFERQFLENLSVSKLDGGFKVRLPFNDYMGDPIEIFISPTPRRVVLDDLGHTAGLLFSLSQHGIDTPSHQLVRSLTDAYSITMDYDRGILVKQLSPDDEMPDIRDFIKVLTSLQTVIPELQRQRKKGRGRTRLASRIGREISQLRLPLRVQKQAEVDGKHETWVVDYKYVRGRGPKIEDVLIVTADLGGKEPRQKAEHILTLAVDVLDVVDKRDLRVIYDVDGGGSTPAAQRAASLIEDYQHRLRYKAYNFADSQQKAELISATIQDLSPLEWRQRESEKP